MMMGMHLDLDEAKEEDSVAATVRKIRGGGGGGGEEMVKLEKEMWETFYRTEFWSPGGVRHRRKVS
ncbi:hypothetical protein LINPERHAP2_LOCUS17539 [Linum perenne]